MLTHESDVTWQQYRRVRPSPTKAPVSHSYVAHQRDYVDRFYELLAAWKMETVFQSSAREKMASPAFAELCNLGPKAIPLIIRELRIRPGFIFLALHVITRENPVPAHARGRVDEAVEAWLSWAERNSIDAD